LDRTPVPGPDKPEIRQPAMETQRKAYLLALSAVFFWSTVASAFKISLRYLDVLQLLFYSTLTSVIVLFLILIYQGKIHLLRTFVKKDYGSSMMLGFLNPFIYYIVLFKAYSLLPAQEAQPLNFTWSIVLALLSIPLLKQKISVQSILGIVVSYAGAFTIATRGDIFGFRFSNPLGVMLALGSAVIWALFWIYNVKDDRDEVAKLFLNFVFGLIFISIAFILFSEEKLPGNIGLMGAVYAGLFEMGITFVIWLKALKLSETTAQVGNLIYLAPFLSLVLIHYVVGEAILPSTIIGLIFIVSGILIQQYDSQIRSTRQKMP
jgi:drug/metabolite transporter (DMT)-like permease